MHSTAGSRSTATRRVNGASGLRQPYRSSRSQRPTQDSGALAFMAPVIHSPGQEFKRQPSHTEAFSTGASAPTVTSNSSSSAKDGAATHERSTSTGRCFEATRAAESDSYSSTNTVALFMNLQRKKVADVLVQHSLPSPSSEFTVRPPAAPSPIESKAFTPKGDYLTSPSISPARGFGVARFGVPRSGLAQAGSRMLGTQTIASGPARSSMTSTRNVRPVAGPPKPLFVQTTSPPALLVSSPPVAPSPTLLSPPLGIPIHPIRNRLLGLFGDSILDGTEDVVELQNVSFTGGAAVGAVSWRGRNPSGDKINQDAALVAEHKPTGAILIAAFDGHGERGREVSHFLADHYLEIFFGDQRLEPALQHLSELKVGIPKREPRGYLGLTGTTSMFPNGHGTPKTAASKHGGPITHQSVCDIMADALIATENLMISSSGIDCTLSGATAVAALVHSGMVYVINAGDSRAVLACSHLSSLDIDYTSIATATAPAGPDGSFAPGHSVIGLPMPPMALARSAEGIQYSSLRAAALAAEHCFARPSVRSKMLTVDHKPDNPKERQRIVAAGGRVAASTQRVGAVIVGPARVWLKNAPMPGLNMSRSVGDLVGKQAGVVSTPNKVFHPLKPDDKLLIIASDGLWDWIPNEEAAALALSLPSPLDAARRMARLSRARWLTRTGSADDTTVIVLRLNG